MPEIKRTGSKQPSQQKQAPRSAVDRYRVKGFSSIGKPAEDPPSIDGSLADYEMDSLAELITKYSNWREYAEELANEQMVTFYTKKAEYEHKEAVFSLTLDGKPTDKKLAVMANEELNHLRVKLLEEELYYTMLTKKVESFSNTLAVLSREITRRKDSRY
jgi:hypothetical protein